MKKILSLLLIFALLLSCKTDSFIELESNETTSTKLKFKELNARRNFHGVVISNTGDPVSGATVTIGNTIVQTNSEGIFSIKGANVNDNFAYVKVTKAGYINGSRTIVPTEGDNRINIMLIPERVTSTISSGTSSKVSLPNGTTIRFDGYFKNPNGSPYTGSVRVSVFHLTASDRYLNELMPGSLLANDSSNNDIIMETYGMVHVQLRGSSGQALQIADGHTAQMIVAIDPSQLSTAPASIPLWSFDETTGVWQEEGVATRVGNSYMGDVSHFSWWNCDAPFPQCTLKVRVRNSTGQFISNAKVAIKRSSQVYENVSHTNNDGLAAGIIPANEVVQLKVYNNCNTVVYATNIGPFAAGSVNTIQDVILPVMSTFQINGSLKTCSGTNVTNGIVYLKYAGVSNYFQTLSAVVNNGNFSFNVMGCNANQQFTLEAFDISNGMTSGVINFTGISPVTNLGNITTCSSITEFVNYQIDAQPVQSCILGFTSGLDGGLQVIHNQVASSPYFILRTSGINSVGSYTSGFTILTGPNNGIKDQGNNLVLQVSNVGAIGDYIDFTINGTYTDFSGPVPVIRSLSATGHVKRDF